MGKAIAGKKNIRAALDSPRLVEGLVRGLPKSGESTAGILPEAREQLHFTSHRVRLPSNSHVKLRTGERERNQTKEVGGVTRKPPRFIDFS
jgi:hypothetical protein